MDKLISIVKIFAISQFILIAILIMSFFLTKIFFHYRERRAKKINKQIAQIVKSACRKNKPLSSKQLVFLKNSPFETLIYLTELDNKLKNEISFIRVSNQLSSELFMPLSRRFAHSRSWFKRYTAALGYSFGFEEVDENNLVSLAKDKSLLIALNAATTLIKHPTSRTINAIIDVFSEGRRLQQSVCSELVMSTSADIAPIVHERLEKEENIYTRIFCYRLLCKLPSQLQICSKAKEDILSPSTDLKIATLNYMNHTQDKLKGDYIFSLTKDPHWEVRAAAAKVLSTHKTRKSLHVLTDMLNDSQWWVCLNAAHSLGDYGDQGMAILSSQAPDTNNFSFEIAQNLMKQLAKQTPTPPINKD
jgi:hypothetical protein